MSLACIIPARGGSQRIPRKNVALFRGVPMLVRTIETARQFNLFKLIVVSTDDAEIEDVALKCGAIVVHRREDDGTKGTQEVARDVLLELPSISAACVLYPCSPLLLPRDLMRGMQAVLGHHFAYSVDSHGADAGCFYFGKRYAFIDRIPLDNVGVKKVALSPGRAIDINTPEDWARAELMFDSLHTPL